MAQYHLLGGAILALGGHPKMAIIIPQLQLQWHKKGSVGSFF